MKNTATKRPTCEGDALRISVEYTANTELTMRIVAFTVNDSIERRIMGGTSLNR